MSEQVVDPYYKELFDICQFSEYTAKILEQKECFWDMAMKPKMDMASVLLPVDYATFPEGTKHVINELLVQLTKSTREAFLQIENLNRKNRLRGVSDNQKVIFIVMNLVQEAFKPFELSLNFTNYVQSMLSRLFEADISDPLARFDDYRYLLDILPFAWYHPINELMVNIPEGKYKFDLLSSYFLRFMITFVGDTTRILFIQIDKTRWRFNKLGHKILKQLFRYYQRLMERENAIESAKNGEEEPVEKRMKVEEPESINLDAEKSNQTLPQFNSTPKRVITEEELYYKNLFGNCQLRQTTSKIMKNKEFFWDMVMQPKTDIAGEHFPVDYETFPEGTKNAINQLFWNMRETTRKACWKFPKREGKSRKQKIRDENVAGIVLEVVEEAFSSLRLDPNFMKRLRTMLIRVFKGGFSGPLATFEDYMYLFNLLPVAWYDPMNRLLVGTPEGKNKFDLLSTYFLRFVIQFVGDTTRILFCRVNKGICRFARIHSKRLQRLYNQHKVYFELIEGKEKPGEEVVQIKLEVTESETIITDQGDEDQMATMENDTEEEPVEKKPGVDELEQEENCGEGLPRQRDELYCKKLYDIYQLLEYNSNMMSQRESFWELALKPETDIATEFFPVDYQTFPEGTKDTINQLFRRLRETTKEACFRIISLREEHQLGRCNRNKKVADIIMMLVEDALSPLKLTLEFTDYVSRMMCKNNFSQPLAKFSNYMFLLDNLPSAWYDPMNELIKEDLNGRYNFDLLSTYFIGFLSLFLGDTLRLLFHRVHATFWRYSDFECKRLIKCFHANQNLEEAERTNTDGNFSEMQEGDGVRNTEPEPEKIPELEKNNEHQMTLDETRNALLDTFPETLQSIKIAISQLLFDENIPDDWKMALMRAVSTTNLLELPLEQAREKFNLLTISDLKD